MPDGDEGPWTFDVPAGIRPDDPRTIDSSHMRGSVNNVVLDNRTVIFGDEKIGSMGSKYAPILYNNRIGKGKFEIINIKGILK